MTAILDLQAQPLMKYPDFIFVPAVNQMPHKVGQIDKEQKFAMSTGARRNVVF